MVRRQYICAPSEKLFQEPFGIPLFRIVWTFIKTDENLGIILIRHWHRDSLIIEDELRGRIRIGYRNRLLMQFGVNDLIALTDSNPDRHGDGAGSELRSGDNLTSSSNIDRHGPGAILTCTGRISQRGLIDHARGVTIAALFICIEKGSAFAQHD